jgi:hypothetical protein
MTAERLRQTFDRDVARMGYPTKIRDGYQWATVTYKLYGTEIWRKQGDFKLRLYKGENARN